MSLSIAPGGRSTTPLALLQFLQLEVDLQRGSPADLRVKAQAAVEKLLQLAARLGAQITERLAADVGQLGRSGDPP